MKNIATKQLGTSLIEMMLAAALGLMLIFSFVELYLTAQKTSNLQKSIAELQENGRLAEHFLSTPIRMAGYAYCMPFTTFLNATLTIQGYKQNPPAYVASYIKKNTDSIEIGECVTRNEQEKFQQFIFFIGATTRKNKIGNVIYALHVLYKEDQKKYELLPGVEDMKISYGFINNSDDTAIVNYLTADQVQDWTKIRAVRISLLLASELPVLAKAEPYTFAENILLADKRLRREWNFYVALRNI